MRFARVERALNLQDRPGPLPAATPDNPGLTLPNFKRQAGDSLSRANSLRPVHGSLRRFYGVSFVCFASLATIALLHSVDSIFRSDVSVDAIGAAAIGIGFLVVAILTAIHLAADCMRRCLLDGMSPQAIRTRLNSQQRGLRYEADPGQLRGMTIGAMFFGVLCAFAVIIRIAGLAP